MKRSLRCASIAGLPTAAAFARHPVAAAVAAAFITVSTAAWAELPTGAIVVNGTAGVATSGGSMTITNSPNAIVNWRTFSIGAQNSVRFEQQSAASQVLNRVVGNDPSNILGSLSSNGGVWLVNPHGVLFGQNARIDVGGLVASTLGISNNDFLTGRLKFEGTREVDGQILNRGEINTTFGGRVWLLGGAVRNEGLIRTPGGSIVLAAGQSIELVDSGAPNVTVRMTAPANEAINLGSLIASAGGSIDVHGGIVNQQGIVRADSAGIDPAGRVVIKAQGDITLSDASITTANSEAAQRAGSVLVESAGGTTALTGLVSATSSGGKGGQIHLLGDNVGIYKLAQVDASGATGGGVVLVGGDYQGENPAVQNATAAYLGAGAALKANATDHGDGGKVIFWGNEAARVYGSIEAKGGRGGGNGGFVETSGGYLDVQPASLDVTAPRGTGGTWLLDPHNITIVPSGGTTGFVAPPVGVSIGSPGYVVTSTADDARISAGIIENQLRNGTSVTVRTGPSTRRSQPGDIVVAASIIVGDVSAVGSLTLQAHNNITLNPGVMIRSTYPMGVTLTADSDGNGAGRIDLGPGAAINTGGPIALNAGSSVGLTGSSLASTAAGTAITIRTRSFTADASASISASNGRWLIYSSNPAGDSLGGVVPEFFQFSAPFGTAPALPFDGVLYSDPLNVRIKVNATRPYDGTVRASFDNFLSHNAPTGFNVQTIASDGDSTVVGAFQNKNAGVDKPVAFAGAKFFISAGARTPVLGGTLSYVGDITPKEVTASSISAANKMYDGTRAATLTGTVSGVLAGDDATLGALGGLFDTKNAGTGKTVSTSGGSLAGADAANYRLVGALTITADITPKPVSVTNLSATDKVYNGSRDAAISGSLAGAIAGDSVSLTGATGLFDTKDVGTGKSVSILGGSLAGSDAGNYVLSGAESTRANITPKALIIGIGGTVSREYDATATATVAATQFVLNGVVINDVVSVTGPAQGSYDSPNVGTGKIVTAAGAFDVAGSDASNYSIGGTRLTGGAATRLSATAAGSIGTITPATLTYNADSAVREPGRPIGVLSGTVTGFKGADNAATGTSGTPVWLTPATAASPPGVYAVNGDGLASDNYKLAQAPGNATALALLPPNTPASPPNLAVEGGTATLDSALRSVVASLSHRGLGGVFDISSKSAQRSFGPVNIASMSQDELALMLEDRKNFKRKLFADAIYKLEIDPSLADVQPCVSVADARLGLCRITNRQLDEVHTTPAKADVPAKAVSTARPGNLPQIERKIAILFGVNDYADKKIPQLENAVPDVDAVSKLFAERLGYEVRVFRNPSKATIISSLNQLAMEVGSSDSVVVYYAGHGYSLDKSGAGYWLPTDAPSNDPTRWISNSDVAKLMNGVRAKQMALISDSCYSGAFAREGMASVGRNVTADDVLTKRSVVVLSSGGDEPVADEGKDGHSIFAWNLMKAVRTVENWRPGSTIFDEVQLAVKKEFPQTPKYGSVTSAGHQQGGDYLFEQR